MGKASFQVSSSHWVSGASPAWGLQYSSSLGSRPRGRWGGASRQYLGVEEGAHRSAPVRGWGGGAGHGRRPRTRLLFRQKISAGVKTAAKGGLTPPRHTCALSPAGTQSCLGKATPPHCWCVQRPTGHPPMRRHRWQAGPGPPTRGRGRAGRPLYGDVRAVPRRVALETTFPSLWFPGPPLPIHLFRQWGRRRFRANPNTCGPSSPCPPWASVYLSLPPTPAWSDLPPFRPLQHRGWAPRPALPVGVCTAAHSP